MNCYQQFSQMLLNKQGFVQTQNDINLTLRGLLYLLETIAYRHGAFHKKYDGCKPNSLRFESINQLINHLRVKSKAFHLLYKEFCEQFGHYSFPDNLNEEEIINDITCWKNYVPSEYKIYYDNVIYILCGRDEKVFYPEIRNK